MTCRGAAASVVAHFFTNNDLCGCRRVQYLLLPLCLLSSIVPVGKQTQCFVARSNARTLVMCLEKTGRGAFASLVGHFFPVLTCVAADESNAH